ncbi:hypothetical protein GAYE_PCTG71G1530 [Galdieria yellowstonensis]|uniref:Pseudouridine synthase RsuA/RluA-like domain-containing protein n=1 Tax=Galdieria yellowstonensis TaxID=3028027 RepID=A0AAV9I8I8_9RHOD|nr:hypothetical protein GAYE_PCTG71G1530 [Galdieria yellowstonensis]
MFLSDLCVPSRLPRKHQSQLIEEEQQESSDQVTGRRPPIVDSIDILYMDDEYLAVNKPADVRMDGDFDVTVTKLVYRKLGWKEDSVSPKPRFVHRLDYATSGVLIAGLTEQSASYLAKLFRERRVEKFYLALVHGWIGSKTIVMEESIANHPVDGFMMTVGDGGGKRAKTECIPLSFGLYGDYLVTKVLLKPFTGRRHQLRVHCKFHGFPIVGDATYGMDSVFGPDDARTPPRMMLHAWKLKVPGDGRRKELWVETPDPFETCFVDLATICVVDTVQGG